MSYFAKPNFIIYDEWFDDVLEKNKLHVKNQKIKTISNVHDFFYEQSNYKVGASENNIQLDIKENKKDLLNKNHLENPKQKDAQLAIKNFRLFEKLSKSKIKFKLTKKIIYSLSIFGFVFTLGSILFFISQANTKEPKITNKPIVLEKVF